MRKMEKNYIEENFTDYIVIHEERIKNGTLITIESELRIITLFFNRTEKKIYKVKGGKYADCYAEFN